MRQPLFLLKFLIHSGTARWLPGVQRRLSGGAHYLHYYSDRLLASPLSQLEDVAANVQSTGVEVIDLAHGSRSRSVIVGPAAHADFHCGAVAERMAQQRINAFFA